MAKVTHTNAKVWNIVTQEVYYSITQRLQSMKYKIIQLFTMSHMMSEIGFKNICKKYSGMLYKTYYVNVHVYNIITYHNGTVV